jgi:diguanylate cyclase (GGDEF)-like protein
MSDWASVLTSALDEVEYGIVLLDKDLEARFINRAYHRMLALPPAPAGTTYNYIDLVGYARATAAYDVGSNGIDAYAAGRIALIRAGSHPPLNMRMADGRILKAECIALPDGGRMLTFADITELVTTAERLRMLATTDDLTKLLNRRHFLASFEQEFVRASRYDRPLAVLMVDADHFKHINDEHGHHVGDEVLRKLAERCRHMMRQSDILGRVGGEEFAAALPEADMPAAVAAAERLRREVASEPFDVNGAQLAVTVSVGVAARRAQDLDPDKLMRQADRALYVAKVLGRNRVEAERLSS